METINKIINFIKTYLSNIFTKGDNVTFSMTKFMVFMCGAIPMTYNFVTNHSNDYYNFGLGILLVGGLLVGKDAVESLVKLKS